MICARTDSRAATSSGCACRHTRRLRERERDRERVSAGVGIHVVCATPSERASQRPNESAASAAEPRSEGEGEFALLHVQRRQLCEREQMGQAGGAVGGEGKPICVMYFCLSGDAHLETVWRSSISRSSSFRSTQHCSSSGVSAASKACQQLVKHGSS